MLITNSYMFHSIFSLWGTQDKDNKITYLYNYAYTICVYV